MPTIEAAWSLDLCGAELGTTKFVGFLICLSLASASSNGSILAAIMASLYHWYTKKGHPCEWP